MGLVYCCSSTLPIGGVLHIEKVPGKGVGCRSDVGEEKRDPELMPGCAPSVCGMDGPTVIDEKEGPTFDEWETPVVNGVNVLLNLGGVPNMAKTMALADDTVGLTLTETSKSLVLCGVTILDDGVGLKLSTVKDTIEVTVEVGPSMDKGGAAIPKVGLFRSKCGKG